MAFGAKNNSTYFLILLSFILYIYSGYFLERTQSFALISTWFVLFGCYYFILQKELNNSNLLIQVSIIFRLIFLFSIPNLSQDFYRFIWDGRMLLNGFNPYESLPETFINQGLSPVFGAAELYEGMGELNGSHYSNYPPLNQLSFLIGALLGGGSILWTIVVLKIQIILADIGIIVYGRKLLKKLGLHPNQIFWYALNPLIILELTGNLHFEPIMLFFLVLSLYKLLQKKWILSALLLACSVSVKLIPLLIVPLFYQWFANFNTKKIVPFLSFGAIVVLVNILLFLPFLTPSLISNYSDSVGLWFTNFEFNASFYYLFRELGYLFRGWNEIAIIGKILPILVVLCILYLSFIKNIKTTYHFFNILLFAFTFYYLFSTTIHPWYLASLILLASFCSYRYPMVWSLGIVLSYMAYASKPYHENFLVIGIEYLLLFGFILFEIRIARNNINSYSGKIHK